MGKLIKNRRATKFTLIGMGAVVILLAAVLMVMSVLDSNVSAEDSGDYITVEVYNVDSSKDYAKDLFAFKIEEVNDTAAVATMFETMEIENVTGEYETKISEEGDIKVLAFNITEPVRDADRKTFDANMETCAEQMLALIPGIGKVQWDYSVVSEENKEESVSVSLDEDGANKELDGNVRNYGKSANKLQKLLVKQMKSE